MSLEDSSVVLVGHHTGVLKSMAAVLLESGDITHPDATHIVDASGVIGKPRTVIVHTLGDSPPGSDPPRAATAPDTADLLIPIRVPSRRPQFRRPEYTIRHRSDTGTSIKNKGEGNSRLRSPTSSPHCLMTGSRSNVPP